MNSNPVSSSLRRRFRLEWLLLLTLALVLGVFAFWRSADLGTARLLTQSEQRLDSLMRGNAGWIRTIRDKFSTLSFALAQDEALRQYLMGNPAYGDAEALNRKFQQLAEDTGAPVLYLLDIHSQTLVSSNWQEPDSFVGNHYGFRPYFTKALEQGHAEYFALGTSSGKAGLYISRMVQDQEGKAVGVVVIKLVFDLLEKEWAGYGDRMFVTDPHGVILLSGEADWRLHSVNHAASEKLMSVRASQQFGDEPLEPVGLTMSDAGPGASFWKLGQERFLHVQQPVAGSDWTLHAMAPMKEALRTQAFQSRLMVMGLLCAALVLTALGLQRNQQRRESQARQELLRDALEEAVESRTAQLQVARRRLEQEMQALQEARSRARDLREQLEQAEKLSFLGQVTAGVAHEINQPVAAIELYADNTLRFLEQGQVETARQNLSRIQALTQRIGSITSQLCHYARKPQEQEGPVRVQAALDSAWQLLEHRARAQGVVLEREDLSEPVQVWALPVRLEQVLVNLLRNALDALEGREQGRIRMEVMTDGQHVRIVVSDNGPGLSPEIRQRLFTPFSSSRRQGVGLGLVISYDIVAALGGRLEEGPSRLGGATFHIVLRNADSALDKEER
ncbi:sensor histidine kinase [Alcaligenes pakistanensis]|uniref:sensor histidine kinase n=1 Tax=Alcaligenes pakistanensis TaxID=1482717 RepID=UPI00227D777A|nr:ATP-binding protein [Alcaligenes pakistanensis]